MTGEGDRPEPRDAHRPAGDVSGSRERWYWLLILPFLALLYPPLYAHATPRIFGIPFFYWYQAVWLILTAGITTLVYRKTR